MRIALDATYSLGDNLSGVGVYSREVMHGLAASHGDTRFLWCYRPHRFLRSFSDTLPANCRRRLMHEPLVPGSGTLFHGLNQRLPQARLRRAVSTFHDLFVLTAEYSTPDFRRRFEQQARDAAERSDLAIAVSGFTARQVEELLGVPRSKIRVVPHGVRIPDAAPRIPREKIVLHVGAIQLRKNISRLVDAFRALPDDWRLVLAGSAGYGAGEILDKIAHSRSIDVLGYVSPAELENWYARASIFAFPSLDEGFGMPVLEAMARGVPVLTSNRSALPEVAGDAALLVDPEDTEAIAAGLRRLAADEQLRNQLCASGKERVRTFTWEAAISGTWSAYAELL